ncbi:glycosyltransferase family 1 protein, partial [Klebsiella pneumoniae]|nr:glycosyltransferase family 1 protein [Klebsiella pneumoniae]
MTKTYAETLLYKQQEFPDYFKFYLKKNKNPTHISENLNTLQKLVRPRLKIVIVTETWPPEINGVAMSLMQLCKG